MIKRYGKASGPLLNLKQQFIDDNDFLLERDRKINAVYAQQPTRTCCKNCEHPLGDQLFFKLGVSYTICAQCGHLNGMFEDTEAFCAAVYTDDSGESYGKSYNAKDKSAYLKRVEDIYIPKVEFLSNSLSQLGESPESLRYADFGAGSGYFVCALIKQGIDQVLGFDVSKSQVALGNTMMQQELLKLHTLEETVGIAESVDAEVVSMIGVLEHLQQPRKFLNALCSNPKVRFLYLSVPTFSLTVFFEMIFPEVMQRHLTQGHTHLYTSQSLDWLAKEFNLRQEAAWWFGADMVDLFRNVTVKLKKNPETSNMVESWTKMLVPLLDAMQLEVDKKHLASEVHILFQLKPQKMSDPILQKGETIHALAKRLWPINRSITGNGVRETMGVLKEILPDLNVCEIPSGTEVFDWKIPDEWNVREAWIEEPDGNRIADFAVNNLHLVGYSIPVDTILSLEELQPHLHSLPDMPEAIPYITSYYSKRWGFCLSHSQRSKLKPGNYRVYLDATLAPGSLTYGELVIPGETDEEVFLSTNVCHPSMANNELSGPCVTAYLGKWLSELPTRRFTYRIIFIPETIGSIAYLSKNLDHLKRHVVAGFNVVCIGDDRCYSYLASRSGNTLSDKVALHVLNHISPDFKRYEYLERGSDERQYCAPGVDLPIATIMRSKFDEYPEYHTSLDNFDFVTPEGLGGGFNVVQKIIEAIESNCVPKMTMLGEPHLSKYGLYPTLNTLASHDLVKPMMDLIAYTDGKNSLLDIAQIMGVPIWELVPIFRKLIKAGVLKLS